MYNNFYWRFQDCGHRTLQNTFHCHIARRCSPDDDMLVVEAVFLPQQPRILVGLLDCKQNTLLKARMAGVLLAQEGRRLHTEEQVRLACEHVARSYQ